MPPPTLTTTPETTRALYDALSGLIRRWDSLIDCHNRSYGYGLRELAAVGHIGDARRALALADGTDSDHPSRWDAPQPAPALADGRP